MSLQELPKLELHLHLEGAAPPSFIRGLAKEKSVDLSKIFREDGSYAYRDFVHFLSVYEAATSVLKTPDDYARLVSAVAQESVAQGVIYTETFVSPDFCGGSDIEAWKDYLLAMKEAADRAQARDGIIMRGIVTCIRHFGPDLAKASAQCAAETVGDWITGFGIAGDEAKGKPRDFAYSFDMAREAGLRLTAHAGEWGEVCPGSNVVLGVYQDWDKHPIQAVRDRGVKVCVLTDDPPFFHTTMTREYEQLATTFGWGTADFRDISQTALDAAFCDADTKAKLGEKLKDHPA